MDTRGRRCRSQLGLLQETDTDKKGSVEQAPLYYALAVVHHFIYNKDPTIIDIIKTNYEETDQQSGEISYYLHQPDIMKHAIKWMIQNNIIVVDEDYFGPIILTPSENFGEIFVNLCQNSGLPFAKYSRVPKPRIWLIAALAEVDRQYYRLKIEGNDFEQPDSEWEPLTLDRVDPLVENMTARVSEVYEQVRADNGYAHSNPEERQYVLSALESTLKRLQQATSISIGYLNKNVREPLS